MPLPLLAADDPSASQGVIAFTPDVHENLREGYVTLNWSAVDGADSYEVIDEDQHPVYRGALPQSFISGLADGTYRYQVRARDDAGEIIASSVDPATVTVKHWPLSYALSLFVVGLLVVIGVVTVIARGVREPGGQRV